MNRHPKTIYTQTGHQQAFLLHETKGLQEKPRSASGHTAIGIRELTERFPLIHTGKTLVEDVLRQLEPFPAFGVILLRLDDFFNIQETSGDETSVTLLLDAAIVVDEVLRTDGGFWGMIEQDLIGAFLPEKTEADCRNIAKNIQDLFALVRGETITAGITEFPMADYDRLGTFKNARKALHHARLLGPGGIAVFDSVSLNISADQLFQEGNIQTAAEELKAALKMNPTDADIRNSLGVCYAAMGTLDSALQEFKAAASMRPDSIMPAHNIGLVHEMMGYPEKALAHLLKADQLVKTDQNAEEVFELPFQIGRIYLQEGLPEKAEPFLVRASALNPASGIACRKLGECLMARGNVDGAVTAFSNAVKRNPNDAAAFSELGGLFHKKGENPDIALLFCRHSVDISPKNGIYRQRLGKLCMALDRLDEALEAFERAHELGCDSQADIDRIKEINAASERLSPKKDTI